MLPPEAITYHGWLRLSILISIILVIALLFFLEDQHDSGRTVAIKCDVVPTIIACCIAIPSEWLTVLFFAPLIKLVCLLFGISITGVALYRAYTRSRCIARTLWLAVAVVIGAMFISGVFVHRAIVADAFGSIFVFLGVFLPLRTAFRSGLVQESSLELWPHVEVVEARSAEYLENERKFLEACQVVDGHGSLLLRVKRMYRLREQQATRTGTLVFHGTKWLHCKPLVLKGFCLPPPGGISFHGSPLQCWEDTDWEPDIHSRICNYVPQRCRRRSAKGGLILMCEAQLGHSQKDNSDDESWFRRPWSRPAAWDSVVHGDGRITIHTPGRVRICYIFEVAREAD